MHQYDAVIIGSGLGGLACGTLLAKEDIKFASRAQQASGRQSPTFVRERVIFDSGVHYVGALEKGQPFTAVQVFALWRS